MGIGRASPPAVGIGIHMAERRPLRLFKVFDISDKIVHDLRIDASRFNEWTFGITMVPKNQSVVVSVAALSAVASASAAATVVSDVMPIV